MQCPQDKKAKHRFRDFLLLGDILVARVGGFSPISSALFLGIGKGPYFK
ncbi:hypothetical protein [Peribacillus frigoritolerans]|nr:hypothetical protein [Peribacillus frigoritolerans]